MSDVNSLLNSFIALGLGILFLIGYLLLLVYFRRKKNVQNRSETTDVGFVVDTFHELVAQLKEKENELEELRKQAEHRAGIAEDYNENILQSVPSGVLSMDEDYKIVKLNTSAARILNVDTDITVGLDAREVLEPLFKDSACEGESIGRGQCRYHTASGKSLWLGYSFTPLTDAEGNQLGRLLVFTDLTELRALEEQAQLRARLSSLGEMAAGIAHELRNSMGVISGYMHILSQRAGDETSKTVISISDEVDVMARIISDFLSFAKPRAPLMTELNLEALITVCADKCTCNRDNIVLSIKMQEPSDIQGDEVMLRQAFTNLLTNAGESMPEGGNLTVTGAPAHDKYILRISDTGHGMDESLKNKVFNPFFTTKDTGTGLGLAIVHSIVGSHGGEITVDSSTEGTMFTITLPTKG
jgi:PAS domain S-box-containing protein